MVPMTLEDTLSRIAPLDPTAMGEAAERQAQLTKPAGALGALEDASITLAGIQATCPPFSLRNPAVAVFAGDHGVHAQGVTPWPQEVTVAMV
jgi:nicotinate-nucleotide--dimethylbenzimidazole phosphoribosyltransferase